MTALYALLVLALGVGAGLTVIVIEEIRWEARSRAPRRRTDGEVHHRHASHH